MINTAFQIYKTVRESEMDAAWCNNSVSWLRRDWRPIVNIQRNARNKLYLLSQQNMNETLALFKEKGEFLNNKNGELLPLPILENVINIFIEELTKNPPKAELTAVDAAALLDRKHDLELFKTKKEHEAQINNINQKVGAPPYQVGEDKFKGKMEGMEGLELNPDDPEDQNFFFQNNRMKYEIAGQSLINSIMKLGRFDQDTLKAFVYDILADKVICMDVYVDQITGEIKYDYIYPDTFYALTGKRNDGSDDIAKGYERSVPVWEFLQKAGNKFIWDRDWRKLLWAINYKANQTFTGFVVNNINYDCTSNMNWQAEAAVPLGTQTNLLQWTQAWTYEIYMGKIQWIVPQVTANYKYKPDYEGNITMPASMPNDWQITTQEQSEGYEQKSFYREQTYEAYYIATSGVSQWIYNWGKLYMQTLEGANDEYSNYSLQYYRERGKSAVELSIPYLKLANDAFYKMVWAVYEAHPDWEVYQVEELTALAKTMYSQAVATAGTSGQSPNNIQDQLTRIIKYFRQNLVKLKAIPRVDGKPMPQMNNVPVKEHRGLDPIAIAMQTVCTWAENQIFEKLGINDVRRGTIDNAREGYKQNVVETQYSKNVTGYVYRMCSYMKLRIATTTLLYAQDIIRFGDSIPYRWIQRLIGEENFENLKVIKEFAAHRFGINVEDINTDMEKQRIIQAADMSLDKRDGRGGLTFDQWFKITTAANQDYKAAVRTITMEDRIRTKKERAQQVQDMQMQHENQMALENQVQQGRMAEAQLVLQGKQIDAKALVTAHQVDAQSKAQVKQMQNDAEAPKQQAKSSAEIDTLTAQNNLKEQQPIS